jgi:YHS domain-containing protein
MVRAVLYLLITVLVLTLLRGVLGILAKSLPSFFQPDAPQRRQPRAGGQLRRDPVCGAYVSEDIAVRKKVGNKTFFFCSEACRDKHHEG